MKNPLLIAFRAGATIMAAVFLMNWLTSPGELSLERAREWEVSSHSFVERAGRVHLLLNSSYGRRVKLNCEYYVSLCAHVRGVGTKNLLVWTDELGYFVSTSLVQARAGDQVIVSIESQQSEYETRSLQRNAPLLVTLALAVLAWRWPSFAKHFWRKNAA